jgi:hypothetical protein
MKNAKLGIASPEGLTMPTDWTVNPTHIVAIDHSTNVIYLSNGLALHGKQDELKKFTKETKEPKGETEPEPK